MATMILNLRHELNYRILNNITSINMKQHIQDNQNYLRKLIFPLHEDL